jgi:hypothetical protein
MILIFYERDDREVISFFGSPFVLGSSFFLLSVLSLLAQRKNQRKCPLPQLLRMRSDASAQARVIIIWVVITIARWPHYDEILQALVLRHLN